VSRGELVEIGGSFRLPEILEAAGVHLREVGTTNRTRIGDYERGRSSETALVLHVHRSNFRMVGFSEDASIEQLAAFCRRESLSFVCDIGSGALRQHQDLFPDEPIVEDAIEAGADVVCFSADKLLGVGQAGILAGKHAVVEGRLLRHPIARVVRLDKTLLAVLEAGLRIQLKGAEVSRRQIPFLRALTRPPAAIAEAVARCAARIEADLGGLVRVGTIEVSGEVGGGSLPGITFPSHAITLSHARMGVDKLAASLRAARPPVIGRIQDDQLLLDLRAILEEDEEGFIQTVVAAIGGDRQP
jgi:L-seryl-tRNA(Ser) seleniumtransferase